jgi:hypothetical protein
MKTEQERVCQRLKIEFQLFGLKEFAAHWCEIPSEDIPHVLKHSLPVTAKAVGAVLVSNPDYPCLETKLRFLIESIENGSLINCDESGDERFLPEGKKEYIAWSRCHISGRRAREFLSKYCNKHKDKLPNFIFPDVEEQYEYIDNKLKDIELENSRLKQEIEMLRKNGVKTYGVYAQVQKMRQEKLGEKFIAISLYSNGNGLSYAQIGALLHPTGDIRQTSLKDYAQDLVNGKVSDFIFFDKYQ